MGRELKRVPLDFSWSLNKPWKGYLTPDKFNFPKCVPCDGSGAGPEALFLQRTWYNHIAQGMFGTFYGSNILSVPDAKELKRMGWDADVIQNIQWAKKFGFTHLAFWSDKLTQHEVDALWAEQRLTTSFKEKPTADQVNAWAGRGFGHDAINQWICSEARLMKYSKQPKRCPLCKGHGNIATKEQRKALDKWKRTEPPEGPGYQLWETVSEGSPITPVFATPEELAKHLARHDNTITEGTSYEQWMKFILGPGWAPSLIGAAGKGVVPGVQGV